MEPNEPELTDFLEKEWNNALPNQTAAEKFLSEAQKKCINEANHVYAYFNKKLVSQLILTRSGRQSLLCCGR